VKGGRRGRNGTIFSNVENVFKNIFYYKEEMVLFFLYIALQPYIFLGWYFE